MKKKETHGFGPCYDQHSEVLILGSFPSKKSRDVCFFYGHPQNRFWPLMGSIFHENVPKSVEGRKAFALKHHIALYDAIESCEISGSSDASISNIVPADLTPILNTAKIRLIILNGKTSEKAFKKYQHIEGIEVVTMPSTSPANAKLRLEDLVSIWGPLFVNK